MLSAFFTQKKTVNAVKIHSELCAIYGHNIESEGTVRQWRRMFRMGEHMFMMKSKVVGHLSWEWSGSEWKTSLNNFRTFMWFSTYSTHCSVQDCHKFCARWVSEMLTGVHKTQNGFSLDFFRVIPQRWWWIPRSHHTSDRCWNLGLICEHWNQSSQSSGCTHIHQTNWESLNKWYLPESCWQLLGQDRKGVLMVVFMQQGTTVTL
jgi:hypothetical protein